MIEILDTMKNHQFLLDFWTEFHDKNTIYFYYPGFFAESLFCLELQLLTAFWLLFMFLQNKHFFQNCNKIAVNLNEFIF